VLRIGAALSKNLAAEMCFLTSRPSTPATEEPPPLGVEIPSDEWNELPLGMQILTDSMKQLIDEGFLAPQDSVAIRAVRNGYLFSVSTFTDRRVLFYERYGHLIDVLNYEIDQDHHDLLIVASPRRSGLERLLSGDRVRQLVIDLHTSFLVVRGGNLTSRFLVCLDGSPSSQRLFPLLKSLLPAIQGPVDLIWVREPKTTVEEKKTGMECVERARIWLDRCGKEGDLLLRDGDSPKDIILQEAGDDSIVVMGASLRHDVHHRVRRSLPQHILSNTESSVLVAKLPPEADTDFFQDLDRC
jgi:nucleotide-binding universal stress UspA family protein